MSKTTMKKGVAMNVEISNPNLKHRVKTTKNKARKKVWVAAVAIAAMALVPTANALTWKTMGKDADYGPGFAWAHVDATVSTGYFNRGEMLFNRRMRIVTHGLPGTTVSVSARIRCWWYEIAYYDEIEDEYVLEEYPENDYVTLKYSFRARSWSNIRWITGLYYPYDGCNVVANAISRDSGPVILTVQRRAG
jgi:hypothetical protein